MDAKELEGVALFSALSGKERGQIARHADELTVPEGTELAREGEFAHEFFVVREGTAEVRRGDEVVNELGPNDFFGEIGLLETERRTATVVATSPLRVIVMFQREFRQMERDHPEVAGRLRAAITARLAD
jgi:CRP/FNR family transcriptional regulator, cyclic AMP receptor protein